MKNDTRVLVICHGNICRSPLVAGFLAQREGLLVRQGGFVNPGKRSPPKIRRWAEAHGLNLETHRARLVTREDCDWAQTILYMDPGNLERLIALYRGSAKVTCLAKYIGVKKIPDPNFLVEDKPVFRQALTVLENATKAFLRAWEDQLIGMEKEP